MNIQTLAKEFGVSEVALAEMTDGVVRRIRIAISKGAVFSEDLVKEAVIHWHESVKQHSKDLLANKNGMKDQLMEDIYNAANK